MWIMLKSMDFGWKKMFPPWILTLEWKLKVSFTRFMAKSMDFSGFLPKSTDFRSKSTDLWVKFVDFEIHGILVKNPPENLWISPKICEFQRILHTWGLGFASSKVFLNERSIKFLCQLLQKLNSNRHTQTHYENMTYPHSREVNLCVCYSSMFQ